MKLAGFFRDQSGQSAVFGALGVLVVVAFVGLAADVGSLRYDEHKLQVAAESAALAAALEVTPCNGTNACSAMRTAAQSALNENGLTGSTVIANCASITTPGLTLMVNNPPCFRGATDPNAGKTGYVEAVVSQTEQTYFARVVGYNNVPLMARAEAQQTSNPNCIYALDQTGGNAITVDLLSSLNATCGGVDESSAPNAFSCNLLAGVHVTSLKIAGGVEQFLCNARPTPHTGVAIPSPADPLAYLPKPAVTACGSSTSPPYYGSASQVVVVLGNATLYPDHAYCGGIVVGPLANVTFMPGTYVIRSAGGGLFGPKGGLQIDLLSSVSGTGVTFYNYGPIGGVNFVASSVTLGQMSLTAPTSGTYAGILFFQDPGNTSPDVIIANSSWNTTLTGAYYFPSSTVTCVASLPSKYSILVAKDITFAVLSFPLGTLNTTTFGNDYSSLANGSPLAGSSAVLVQ
jgi:Flp pilus assembly protein TadG